MPASRSTHRSAAPSGPRHGASTRLFTIAIAVAVVLISVPLAFLVISWTDNGKPDGGLIHVGLPTSATPSHTTGATTAPPTTPPATKPPATKPPAPTGGYYTWALIDRHTGEIRGSDLARPAFSESTVKIWLAADYLNLKGQGGIAVSAPDLALLQKMIRFSDDDAADTFYSRNGGTASITRMISKCQLGDTTVTRGWWSKTNISARDLAKLGQCIADGRATNPEATTWILEQMRNVGGDGNFGIKFALPEAERPALAIKNGWYNHGVDGKWRVLCLAVHADWILAVENVYPSRLGRPYGEQNCIAVAKSVLAL